MSPRQGACDGRQVEHFAEKHGTMLTFPSWWSSFFWKPSSAGIRSSYPTKTQERPSASRPPFDTGQIPIFRPRRSEFARLASPRLACVLLLLPDVIIPTIHSPFSSVHHHHHHPCLLSVPATSPRRFHAIDAPKLAPLYAIPFARSSPRESSKAAVRVPYPAPSDLDNPPAPQQNLKTTVFPAFLHPISQLSCPNISHLFASSWHPQQSPAEIIRP